MKILGIDPGMARLGWSVLETAASGSHRVQFGCLVTLSHTPLSLRLARLYEEIMNLIETHQPDTLAIETLFFVKNAKTLAQVGHVRGVVLLAAAQNKMAIYEYAPRQIKMALTGFGGADKFQMQHMIQRLLGLKTAPQPDDAADAVAVALCHAQFAPTSVRSTVTV